MYTYYIYANFGWVHCTTHELRKKERERERTILPKKHLIRFFSLQIAVAVCSSRLMAVAAAIFFLYIILKFYFILVVVVVVVVIESWSTRRKKIRFLFNKN